jgi:hypothetical protein
MYHVYLLKRQKNGIFNRLYGYTKNIEQEIIEKPLKSFGAYSQFKVRIKNRLDQLEGGRCGWLAGYF